MRSESHIKSDIHFLRAEAISTRRFMRADDPEYRAKSGRLERIQGEINKLSNQLFDITDRGIK